MDFPSQLATSSKPRTQNVPVDVSFDIRKHLNPRRLTILMWDQAFLWRHYPGGSYEDYDLVLAQTLDRGYNTVRLDPLPQWVNLKDPNAIVRWNDPGQPFMPWARIREIEGPVGRWLIDFMAALKVRELCYTLSCWWQRESDGPQMLYPYPACNVDAAEIWVEYLEQWERRFGFDGLLYVDIHNENPYFIKGYREKIAAYTGHNWGDDMSAFLPEQAAYLTEDINAAMKIMQRAFPQLRFTTSIHGDIRWTDLALDFDCLDVHFYVDSDNRWKNRTGMHDHLKHLMTSDHWYKEFSDRCAATHHAVAPMLRAMQRDKLMTFAEWAQRRGMPLTTSESWASWFYIDHPDLDWGWLLDWAAKSVEDAIDARMWGWTPHNYGQPQFANWNDVAWHQRLTEKFLAS